MIDRIRTGVVLAAAAGVLAACGASGPGEAGRKSTAALPAGYQLRLDRDNRDPATFTATLDDGALSVRTGPAGILYRADAQVDTERYQVRGRFTEVAAPRGHREGYGPFIGGQGLETAGQRYTYFLIRGDGRYLIKQRDGVETWELTDGWQPSDAIRVPAGTGDVANDLAITVEGPWVRFAANGTMVAEVPSDDVSTRGVAGVRVNHNLHVRVEGLEVVTDQP